MKKLPNIFEKINNILPSSKKHDSPSSKLPSDANPSVESVLQAISSNNNSFWKGSFNSGVFQSYSALITQFVDQDTLELAKNAAGRFSFGSSESLSPKFRSNSSDVIRNDTSLSGEVIAEEEGSFSELE